MSVFQGLNFDNVELHKRDDVSLKSNSIQDLNEANFQNTYHQRPFR